MEIRKESLNESLNELKDMLKGNIARVCVSESVEEIKRMRDWAKERIDMIAQLRIEEIEVNAHSED